jgi:hypothetical protein
LHHWFSLLLPWNLRTSQLPMGSGVKRPQRETNHSPSSRTEVKSACSYTLTPTYVFIALWLIKHGYFVAWYLVKHRDFTLNSYLLRVYLFFTRHCSIKKADHHSDWSKLWNKLDALHTQLYLLTSPPDVAARFHKLCSGGRNMAV